ISRDAVNQGISFQHGAKTAGLPEAWRAAYERDRLSAGDYADPGPERLRAFNYVAARDECATQREARAFFHGLLTGYVVALKLM
ncbi:MAG TPA: hypothetical protein VMX16_10330, partial [Terriglobia bacterium]|nr:hypothetical protein [Terriglobia bacterium]